MENNDYGLRYHMYFPISEVTDASRYASLKRAIQSAYSFLMEMLSMLPGSYLVLNVMR